MDGIERRFFGYAARGIPYGPDDGTIAPWTVIASLPFVPELVLESLRDLLESYPEIRSESGLLSSFNPTFNSGGKTTQGWVCPHQYGLDQGPVVLMIENHRSEFLWRLMRKCSFIVTGLRRASFRNVWLGSVR